MGLDDSIWCYMMLYDVIWCYIWCFMTMLKILGDCSIMIDTLVGGWDTRTANCVTLLDRGSSPTWQSKQIWNEPTCSSVAAWATGSHDHGVSQDILFFESPTSLGSTGKISPSKDQWWDCFNLHVILKFQCQQPAGRALSYTRLQGSRCKLYFINVAPEHVSKSEH